ncbi:MAG: methyltransferase domain-containing protein [Chloroflexota bacterium]|nr:methyltransferase domain-containing protein [Chloroflexota bacterium]
MTDTQQTAPGSSRDSQFSASSTGQPFTASAGLDSHFEMNRPEYEAMCRSVGLQPGWRVLDAGCGPGGFLPILADLVGPTGSIAAIDLAPENAATAEERAREWRLPCPVEVRTGSVTALPYPDEAFDAVWCANTLMYVNDVEMAQALAEMRRVVRPGGLIAVKETDPSGHCVLPGDPLLDSRFRDARARASAHGVHGMRARATYHWLKDAGLVDVRQRLVPIERFAPFDRATEEGFKWAFRLFAQQASELPDLSEADQAAWRALGNPDSADNPFNSPDAYSCESNILAAGRVP